MNVNVILPFALALPLFLFAYRYFSRYLRNVLSGGREEPAPAVVLRDDVDYVPTARRGL